MHDLTISWATQPHAAGPAKPTAALIFYGVALPQQGGQQGLSRLQLDRAKPG